MEEPKFFIPSVITQSCFVDADGNVVELKPKEIDYFYLLLFLYREKLLQNSPGLILKTVNGHLLDEDALPSSVCIYAVSFNDYGVVVNHQYDGLRAFVKRLSNLSIIVNLFGKDKNIGTPTMKIVESLSWENNEITIALVDNFAKMIVYSAKPFLRLNLNNLFELSGGKAKLIYLLLKDYSKIGKKNLTKNQLRQLLGSVPQKSLFDGIRDQINEQSNIRFSYETERKDKQKTFKFKINYLSENESEYGPNAEVMEKSKKQLQKRKDEGKVIYNEEGYLREIYKSEMKKLAVADEMIEIDKILESKKDKYDVAEYEKNEIPMVVFINKNTEKQIFIDDDYRLTDCYIQITDTAQQTLDKIREWKRSKEFDLELMYMNTYPSKFGKMCLLSPQQLRSRGCI